MCCHENFPPWKIAYNLLAGTAFLGTGALVALSAGLGWLDAYLGVLLLGLVLTVATICNRCAYFGRRCALGVGKLVPLLRRRGRPEEFCRTWPQLLAIAALIAAPVIALVAAGRLLLAGEWLMPAAYGTAMLAFVLPHPRWMCRYCLQREAGPCRFGQCLVRLANDA